MIWPSPKIKSRDFLSFDVSLRLWDIEVVFLMSLPSLTANFSFLPADILRHFTDLAEGSQLATYCEPCSTHSQRPHHRTLQSLSQRFDGGAEFSATETYRCECSTPRGAKAAGTNKSRPPCSTYIRTTYASKPNSPPPSTLHQISTSSHQNGRRCIESQIFLQPGS